MKNKYYVNGKLVRTSENPDYKYGIIYYYINRDNQETFKLIACSTTYEGINKRFNEEYKYLSNENIISSLYGKHSKEKAKKLKLVELEKVSKAS